MDTQVFAGRGSVPQAVSSALTRVRQAQTTALCQTATGRCGRARKMGRIAELYEREARWWHVLGRWTCRQTGIPVVFDSAIVAASSAADRRARQYREWERAAWDRALRVAADSGVAA